MSGKTLIAKIIESHLVDGVCEAGQEVKIRIDQPCAGMLRHDGIWN